MHQASLSIIISPGGGSCPDTVSIKSLAQVIKGAQVDRALRKPQAETCRQTSRRQFEL